VGDGDRWDGTRVRLISVGRPDGDFIDVERDLNEILIGIRPENVRTVTGGEPNAIDVEIDVIEPLGKGKLFYYELGRQTYTGSVGGHESIAVGDEGTLQIPEETTYLFDARTGETLKD
jgi:ABC-type sugar transport system ATPase subunit